MNIFFSKQTTAYEMRIIDWSSDVCSSDLAGLGHAVGGVVGEGGGRREPAAELPAGEAAIGLDAVGDHRPLLEIGRASCRDRVCPYVSITVVAGSFNKNKQTSIQMRTIEDKYTRNMT